MGLIQPKLVASCARCELRIAAEARNRAPLEDLLRLHEAYCPGGDRSNEVWMPFAVTEFPTSEIEIASG